MGIRPYKGEDRGNIEDLFSRNIELNKDYISHGEVQMGISSDGVSLVPDFKKKWALYLDRHHSNKGSYIYLFEDEAKIIGFIIFGIENDYAEDYGVVYDIVVNIEYRKKGIGNELLEFALEKLKRKGLTDFYLESGISNHVAHKFFEKKGFKHISNIYRLADNGKK